MPHAPEFTHPVYVVYSEEAESGALITALKGLREVVEAAFAHRRKTAANSIALAGVASRSRVEQELEALGHSPRARAEELEPYEFVPLADALR